MSLFDSCAPSRHGSNPPPTVSRHNAKVDSTSDDARTSTTRSLDVRHDPFTDSTVHIVGHRQSRPSMPTSSPAEHCPFCPGGLEAPQPYDTLWFPNRWPAMPDERCEVVLYTPNHSATLPQLGTDGVRRVIDLWAERTMDLSSRSDVDYVLIFENRGAEVGATISHPHCQIYAYDHVPARPRMMFARQWRPVSNPARDVTSHGIWSVFVPDAPAFPVAVTIAPQTRRSSLPELDDEERTHLATALVDTFDRLDRLFDTMLPTMMWINQRPTNNEFPDAWMSIEIVSPWRAPGLPRYIAAAEIGAGEFFLPVVPEDIAASLRDLNR